MTLYVYIKAPPVKPRESWLNQLSLMMLFSGLIIILFVIYPIIGYKLRVNLRNNQVILSPVPEHSVASPETSQVLASEEVALLNPDLEVVANWFPSVPIQETRITKITDYTISIRKLKIEDAHVKIGGKKLKETLVQYPGTALPGEYGNVVIFGHSVLPQFFNPKNYKTIFSTLPDLEKGDEVIVDFDGIRFVYQVARYFEIEPNQVEVLEQRFDRQSLTLITCVPPGTYWKRGVAQAYLQKI